MAAKAEQRERDQGLGGQRLDRSAQAGVAIGVDYVPVGALTHSAPALDLGMDLEPVG